MLGWLSEVSGAASSRNRWRRRASLAMSLETTRARRSGRIWCRALKEIADSAGADPVEQLVMADRVGHAARELYCRAESGPQGSARHPFAQIRDEPFIRPSHQPKFRLLFFGQAISQLGDWFNSVAVFALLLDLTGSATAVAWMMIVQFLPDGDGGDWPASS